MRTASLLSIEGPRGHASARDDPPRHATTTTRDDDDDDQRTPTERDDDRRPPDQRAKGISGVMLRLPYINASKKN
jgi:hypothetical protein